MARGRDAFERVEPILNFVARLLGLLPRRVAIATYWLISPIPGNVGYAIRYIWAKRLAKTCGKAVKIGPGCVIRNWHGLSLGDYTGFNEGCYIDALGGITMEEESGVGHHATIVSFSHGHDFTSPVPFRQQPLTTTPVHIGRSAMIYTGVRVLEGCRIGAYAIVAANSVLKPHQVLEDCCVYGGLPAKLIARNPYPPAPEKGA